MESASKEQVEQLMKSIADVTKLVQEAKTENASYRAEAEAKAKRMLEDALRTTPGVGQPAGRKLVFEGATNKEQDIIATLPKELKSQIDNTLILSKILGRPVQSLKSWGRVQSQLGDFGKALAVATAGEGAEWVPTGFSDQLYEFVRLTTKIAQLFDTVDMPTNPYKLPVQLGRFTSYKSPENTANTGQTAIPFGDPSTFTGNQTLTAVPHSAAVLVSKDVEEDSIIPLLPRIQNEFIVALAEGREDAIMNGDVAGTHEDSDTTNAADRRKMWDGLRKMAIANSYQTDLSTFNTANLRGLRQSMGKFGVDPNKLAWACSVTDFIKMLGLAEVITMEKYGPQATIVTGELAKLDNIPVVVSEFSRMDLNASGVFDNSVKTKTSLSLVYRPGFVVGVRRDADIQVLREAYAIYRQDGVIATERVVFAPIYPVASNKTTWLGYNIA